MLTSSVAEKAAQLRATYKLFTPDSIQMATAINQKASFFLTNDMHLPVIPGLKMLVLDVLKAQSQDQP
jgi:predicted nucleic acid-binding protein